MRVKEYTTFQWYESGEEYVDEKIAIDLDAVVAVKKHPVHPCGKQHTEIFTPGSFMLEIHYDDFLKDWLKK